MWDLSFSHHILIYLNMRTVHWKSSNVSSIVFFVAFVNFCLLSEKKSQTYSEAVCLRLVPYFVLSLNSDIAFRITECTIYLVELCWASAPNTVFQCFTQLKVYIF